jgi:hypothetical protein
MSIDQIMFDEAELLFLFKHIGNKYHGIAFHFELHLELCIIFNYKPVTVSLFIIIVYFY